MIGNFTDREATALLRRVALHMLPGDAFLLGADTRKDAGVLEAAYNDARGVTAEFNRNLLRAAETPHRHIRVALFGTSQHRRS